MTALDSANSAKTVAILLKNTKCIVFNRKLLIMQHSFRQCHSDQARGKCYGNRMAYHMVHYLIIATRRKGTALFSSFPPALLFESSHEQTVHILELRPHTQLSLLMLAWESQSTVLTS